MRRNGNRGAFVGRMVTYLRILQWTITEYNSVTLLIMKISKILFTLLIYHLPEIHQIFVVLSWVARRATTGDSIENDSPFITFISLRVRWEGRKYFVEGFIQFSTQQQQHEKCVNNNNDINFIWDFWLEHSIPIIPFTWIITITTTQILIIKYCMTSVVDMNSNLLLLLLFYNPTLLLTVLSYGISSIVTLSVIGFIFILITAPVANEIHLMNRINRHSI